MDEEELEFEEEVKVEQEDSVEISDSVGEDLGEVIKMGGDVDDGVAATTAGTLEFFKEEVIGARLGKLLFLVLVIVGKGGKGGGGGGPGHGAELEHGDSGPKLSLSSPLLQ